jgi:hypothetical protein
VSGKKPARILALAVVDTPPSFDPFCLFRRHVPSLSLSAAVSSAYICPYTTPSGVSGGVRSGVPSGVQLEAFIARSQLLLSYAETAYRGGINIVAVPSFLHDDLSPLNNPPLVVFRAFAFLPVALQRKN